MARITYLSRTDNRHDRRWVKTIREVGHEVTPVRSVDDESTLRELRVRPTPDLVVAGPITDAVPQAASADVAPVLGIAWAFDVLVEARCPEVSTQVRQAMRRVAGVHTDCIAIAEEVQALGCPADRISVAAWGIDTDFFRPGLDERQRQEASFPDDAVVVLSTRAWEDLYAVDVVLDAVAIARQVDPRIKLVLAGDGSRGPEVRSRLGRSDLAGSVVTPGVLDAHDLRRWLHGVDVFAGAARSDGTSLSLLEALACGVPAVVPRLGGNPEWVRRDVDGRLFEPDDPSDLAAHLVAVARDLVPANQIERRARREAVLERGSWDRNRAIFLAAVDRALGGTP